MLALSRRLWCGGDPGGGIAFLGATAAEQVLAKQCPVAGCRFKVVCFCVVRRWMRRGPHECEVSEGQDFAFAARWWPRDRRLWMCGLRLAELWWRSCGALLWLAAGYTSDGVEHHFDGACFGGVLLVPLPGCSGVTSCWIFARFSIIN